jgi:hypothetical protein
MTDGWAPSGNASFQFLENANEVFDKITRIQSDARRDA